MAGCDPNHSGRLTISFEIDAESNQSARAKKSTGPDFIAEIVPTMVVGPTQLRVRIICRGQGKNVISVFRFSPRHAQAPDLLKSSLQLSGEGDR